MDKTLFPFLLTSFAGLSTMIGFLFLYIKPKKEDHIIIGGLSFAAGVMIMVSFTDLLPESIRLLKVIYQPIPMILMVLLSFNVGMIISFLLDKYFPDNNTTLYRVGIISMLAIMIHNIPEGIATFMAGSTNPNLGITMAIAIALHNIPEGISISIPIYYATKNKKKAFLCTLLSGLSELLGAVLTYLFLKNWITDQILGFLFAGIAGIMLHIAFYELLPTALNYKKKEIVVSFFLSGFAFMLVSHILFH